MLCDEETATKSFKKLDIRAIPITRGVLEESKNG
jgi:hypothetical protein